MPAPHAHLFDGDTPSDVITRALDESFRHVERQRAGDLATADHQLADLLVNPDVRAPGTQGGLVDPAWGTPAQQWAATAELLAGVGRVRIGTIGDAHASRELAARALERLGDQSRLEASEAQLVLGDSHLALGDSDLAMQAYRAAAKSLTAMAASRRAAGAWRKLAERYRAAGELERALDAFASGMTHAGFPEAIGQGVGAAGA